jgi:hypothetical protein
MSISPVPGSREENAVSRGTPVDQLRVICVRTATSPSINAAQAEVPLADLLRRVAGRDSQIFQQLYDRTAPQVYSTALAVVRDNHRADRITQQVYCDVWWRAAEFDASAGSVESWLSLLTRARLVDDLRHSRLERNVRPTARTQPGSAAESWLRSIREGAIAEPVGAPASAA